jgi:hypothetical protein
MMRLLLLEASRLPPIYYERPELSGLIWRRRRLLWIREGEVTKREVEVANQKTAFEELQGLKDRLSCAEHKYEVLNKRLVDKKRENKKL